MSNHIVKGATGNGNPDLGIDQRAFHVKHLSLYSWEIMRMTKHFIYGVLAVVMLAIACESMADKGDITVHTVSAHIGVSGLNNVNPGIGYDVTDHIRVGGLYNSYRKPSAYVMGFAELHPRVRVGAGIISGYGYSDGQVYGKTASVLPAVALEVDITDHVSVVWFGQALNLELKF